MAAIHVREIDDVVIDALRSRAAKNHRSLQGEIRHILERAALEEEDAGGKRRKRKLHIRTVSVGGPVYSRKTIYD